MEPDSLDDKQTEPLGQECQRVRAIQQFMVQDAQPGFDDEDIENLQILIRLAVEFHDFLLSAPPWPRFPNDPFQNMTYAPWETTSAFVGAAVAERRTGCGRGKQSICRLDSKTDRNH